MIWANQLGQFHFYLIGSFVAAYLLYLFRLMMIAYKKTRVSPGNILKKLFIRSVYMSLIMIALLGPSFGDIKKELKSQGKEIYFVLDVSNSMMAYDVVPSRLERAKKEIRYLLRHLRYNDRIGLIIFAGQPYLQCPLTYDLDAFDLYLEAASPESVKEQGSDIAGALDFFYQKEMGKSKVDSSANAKVVILATDGDGASDRSLEIARKLKQNQITLYILGIGTDKGSKVPSHPGFKTDGKGKIVISKLERNDLTLLAGINGEDFFSVGKYDSQTEHLLDKINSIEGVVKEVKKIDLSSNKYYYFLTLALFFILIDCLMTVNIVKI